MQSKLPAPGREAAHSVKFLELFADDGGRKRNVFGVLLDGILTLTAEDVAEKLAHLRVDRLARVAAKIIIDLVEERVGTTVKILKVQFDVIRRAAWRDGDPLGLRCGETVARVADAVAILGDCVSTLFALQLR